MYSSETFGRWFWVDDNYEFKSCPLNVDGTGDFNCEDYVSEWDDFTDVDMNELLNIHKFCILNKINYAGSLTHKEEKVINSQDLEGDISTVRDEDYKMNVYDEKLYEQIVLDYEYRFPKFDVTNYPIHLTQH